MKNIETLVKENTEIIKGIIKLRNKENKLIKDIKEYLRAETPLHVSLSITHGTICFQYPDGEDNFPCVIVKGKKVKISFYCENDLVSLTIKDKELVEDLQEKYEDLLCREKI